MISLTSVRRRGLGMVFAGALAACDENDGIPTIAAANDTLTITAGSTGQVLGNDTVGGAPAGTGPGGNVVFAVTSASLPTGITADNGIVSVAATTAQGTYNFTYRICWVTATHACAGAAVEVTVPAPEVVARYDQFNLGAGGSGNVLINDTVGGAPATAALVTVSATAALPTGITLSAAGVISVDGSVLRGTYDDIPYRICLINAPTSCARSSALIIVPAPGGGNVGGRVVDSITARGVPNVTVTIDTLTTTTGSDGAFVLSNVTAGPRIGVQLVATTHAETTRLTDISATAPTSVQLRMAPIGVQADLAVGTGGAVNSIGSPGQVALGADSVQRADGGIPSGYIHVKLTALDLAADSTLMPGDFTAAAPGAPRLIESFGAIHVDLRDTAGAALNMRRGQTATIRIPLSSRNTNPPATIPLYWFDTRLTLWMEEGNATLAGSGNNRYYEGTVGNRYDYPGNFRDFRTWSAGQVYETVGVSGCVADANGMRVANAQVYGDGINYTGTSYTTTYFNGSGDFTIPIRRGSTAKLVASANGLQSNPFTAGPYSSSTQTLNDCLTLVQTAPASR